MHFATRPTRRTRARVAVPALLAGLVASALSIAAWAVEPFVVRDIRVEGVQRTEAGTIFSYLPIKVGDRVTDERISDAVKALYATGFFRDVRLWTIASGTSEIMREIIAKKLLP